MSTKQELIDLLSHTGEAQIRNMICHWLGCTPPSQGAAGLTLPGNVQSDGFYFDVPLVGSGGKSQTLAMHLDTGAFEMLVTKDAADQLQLPNDGELSVAGVTGSSKSYKSHVTIAFDSAHTYQSVPCVVDPSYTGTPLFGFRFFIDQALALTVDPVKQTLALTQA